VSNELSRKSRDEKGTIDWMYPEIYGKDQPRSVLKSACITFELPTTLRLSTTRPGWIRDLPNGHYRLEIEHSRELLEGIEERREKAFIPLRRRSNRSPPDDERNDDRLHHPLEQEIARKYSGAVSAATAAKRFARISRRLRAQSLGQGRSFMAYLVHRYRRQYN